MSSKTTKDRASVCAFLFADDRQCRMLRNLPGGGCWAQLKLPTACSCSGATTAIIFAVIQQLIEAKFGPQHDSPPKAG